jgi:1-acyl-sn-glycerol-3-phosphate acyltransferase
MASAKQPRNGIGVSFRPDAIGCIPRAGTLRHARIAASCGAKSTRLDLKSALASAFLGLTGWKPEGERPAAQKFVLIAAPHTSNWDLAYLLAISIVMGVRVSWMGKHTLFRQPFGALMRAVGGIPVYRHRREGLVAQMAQRFAEAEELVLTIPPEATRGRAEVWKSGFYQIALRARVPIVMGYLDYARKRGGFGPSWVPSGDPRREMDAVRRFYAGIRARYPANFAVPRLAEETSTDAD